MSASSKNKPQPSRGRKLEFDPEEVMRNAMLVFWRKGYAATTYADLVHETGVHRYGLYKVLGDKDQAFIKVLEHYVKNEITAFTAPLRDPEAGLQDIHNYFNSIIALNEENPIGCMVCNVIASDNSDNTSITAINKEMLTMVKASLANALNNAKTMGELIQKTNVEELATTLLGAMVGASTIYRSPLDNENGKIMIKTHLNMLENYRSK